MIGSHALTFENVETCTGNLEILERGGERRLIYQCASCRIDENSRRLHARQLGYSDQPARIWQRYPMQAYDIGFGQQRIQGSGRTISERLNLGAAGGAT